MFEVIPQRVYKIDGVPAGRSGEWPGIKSNHWKGSKLLLKPILTNLEPQHGLKHYPPMKSVEYVYKPGKKLVPPFDHPEGFKPSKRYIVPCYTEPPQYSRHIGIRPRDQIGYAEDAPMFVSKRHYKIKNDKKEFTVEDLMTRKKVIESLNMQRNGFLLYNPGEKPFSCVENSPDFFKMEGIIPGSTNTKNVRKTVSSKNDNFYSTLDLKVRSLNPDKLYSSKILRERLETETKYVNSLENWDLESLGIGKKPKEEGKEKEPEKK